MCGTIKTSEAINEIAAALSVAQAKFSNPQRNRTVKVRTKAGDTYEFAYATLDAILDMVRGPLGGNSLALCHAIIEDAKGPLCITRLMHASGQWIETAVPVLVADGANAQGWGSAITYAKRYGLCALLGVAADEDDDGNTACGNHATAAHRAAKPAPAKPANKPDFATNEKAAMTLAVNNESSVRGLCELLDGIDKLAEPARTELLAHCRARIESVALAAIPTMAAENLPKALAVAKTYLLPDRLPTLFDAITKRTTELGVEAVA